MDSSNNINLSKSWWEKLIDGEYKKIYIEKDTKFNEIEKNIFTNTIHGELNDKLLKLTNGNEVILYIVLMTIYKITLKRYDKSNKILIGIPPYIKDNKGICNNLFIVSNDSNILENSELKEIFTNEKNMLNESYKHQHYPLDYLYKIKNISSIINAYCCIRNIHREDVIEEISKLEGNDINLIIEKNEDNVKLEFVFSKNIKESDITKITKLYNSILRNALNDLTVKLKDIKNISIEEENKILYEFNDTTKKYNLEKPINIIIEEQVEKIPNHTAVVYGDNKLTYRELNERANSLARILIDKGINKESIVGILVKNSIEMIIGILGVLKSGAGYLPIDPSYPTDRIKYIIEDSKTSMILTQDDTNNQIKNLVVEKINLSEINLDKINSTNLNINLESNNLAYVIYTSGTTGNPKGVVVEHRSLLNLCYWHNEYYNVNNEDRVAKYAGVAFDASVWEIFPYLIAGATIYIVSEDIRLNTEVLNKYYEKEKITIAFLPTSIFEEFIKLKNHSLKRLLTGADKLRYFQKQSYDLYNNYGPTEYTIVTTSFKIDKEYENIPIGRPISNTNIYILDENMDMQPIGVPGELCVSGDGIAREYLYNEKLTADKFVVNPFDNNNTMYRTGDLARWLPNGNIEYLGRIDHQVKIRGFRIELGEIESNLLKIDGISNAIVIAINENDENKLIGYYVSKKEYSILDLRKKLLNYLPEYMIPSYLIKLDIIPLNSNGKVDRKKLSNPKVFIECTEERIAPRNEIEYGLVNIWKKILKKEEIGVGDNFFEIGGHSLKANAVVVMIQEVFNVEIQIKDIFSLGNIENLAKYISESNKVEFKNIEKVEENEYYEASSAEKRMYMMQEMNKSSTAYNITWTMDVEGNLDIDRIDKTVNKIIERHEILRTNFYVVNENIVQKINRLDEVNFNIREIKVSSRSEAELKIKELIRPFDLSNDLLIRLTILKINENNSIFLFDIHHIISDGTSISLFVKEFSDLYSGDMSIELGIQYKDYSNWQLNRRNSCELKLQEEYWMNEFKEEVPILNLSTDFQRQKVRDFKGASINFKICKDITEKINKIAKSNESTLYMSLLTVINILLAKYSRQGDIVVGTPIAGRNHKDIEKVMGVFVNTLAIRNKLDGDLSFRELLQTVKNKMLKAYENQEYQFDELVEKLGIERDMSRNPLFDCMFVLQNTENEELKLEQLKLGSYNLINNIEKFDLTITIEEIEGELNVNLSYATSLFLEETILNMGKHFENILKIVVNNEDVKIKDIEMISDEDRFKIMDGFNNTECDFPREKTIQELFEEQVEREPENVAVIYKDESITYREFNKRINSLARILRKKGIKQNSIVGIMVERSFEMMIGIMAILKAGGAYLPIDPHYPEERVNYITENSNMKLLLTTSNIDSSKYKYCEVLNLDNDSLYLKENSNLELICNSNDLAYVIYTSGSTGNPKGVMINHSSIVNRINWGQKKFKFKRDDIVLQKTTFTFDVSVCELLWWLQTGASLVMLEQGYEKYPDKIVETINRENVTTIHFVPSMLNSFMDYVIDNEKYDEIKSLKRVFASGEALKREQSNRFNKHIRKNCRAELTNLYGPTEAAVEVTYYDCIGEDSEEVLPIGKSIDNVKMYIVDKYSKMLPVGIAGELCISGVALARGYLNNKEMTDSKFIDNPYELGKKMYKTGDLAKWMPDGNIEYLGRIDHQVKIRGFRIEIGEIESSLLKIKGITEVIVLERTNKLGNYLCAYYISSEKYTISQLRSILSKYIPDYMIPSYFIELIEMPITSNGKLDRKALPEPSDNIETGVVYIEPRDYKENILADAFKKVLGVSKVGIDDDFFDLGGDSIKAIQIVSKVRAKGYYLDLKDIFLELVIRNIAKCIKKDTRNIEQGPVDGELPLTSIQKYFFDCGYYDINHWNQGVVLFNKDGFNEKILDEVFKIIIKHHDALRMIYKKDKNKIIQLNRGNLDSECKVEVFDYRGNLNGADLYEEIKGVCSKVQREIDIFSGMLIKPVLFKTNEGDHLFIAIHHLVVDGVSWRIIFEDIESAYTLLEENKKVELPKKTSSFKKWAWELKNYSNSERVKSSIKYWREIENKLVDELPKDNLSTEVYRRRDSKFKKIVIPESCVKKLFNGVNTAYNTEVNEILIATLVKTIGTYFNRKNVLISLEGHGREEIHDDVDITRTVGWFTSQYPAIFENKIGIDTLVKNVKDALRQIPNKGMSYGVLKYLTDNVVEDKIKFNLQPEISFNYLGRFDEDVNTSVFKKSDIDVNSLISEKNQMMFSLDFTVMLVNDKLEVSLIYNSKEYFEDTIEEILKEYTKNIKLISDFCISIKTPVLTATDISKEDITLDDLEVYKDRINNIQEICRLFPMQKSMLFHHIYDKESEAYHESMVVSLRGNISICTLEAAFNELIRKHDILRTNFDNSNFSESMQIIYKNKKENIKYIDISDESIDEQEYISQLILSDRSRGFNLLKDTLIRLMIVKINKEDYKLILSNHHIIMDGWCFGTILGDLFEFYSLLKNEEEIQYDKPLSGLIYLDWLKNKGEEEARKYWKEYLLNFTVPSIIPYSQNSSNEEYKNKEYYLQISPEKTDLLDKITAKYKVTMNVLLQAVWSIQLQRYNNTNDSVFGFVVSGRNPEVSGIEKMMGLFINTIPLRIVTKHDMTFSNLLKNINSIYLKNQKYDYYPLSSIQLLSGCGKDLINTLLVFENYPLDKDIINQQLERAGLEFVEFEAIEQTNYDFNIIISNQEGILVKFIYNESKYSYESVKSISGHFEAIVNEVINNENVRLEDINIFNDKIKVKEIEDQVAIDIEESNHDISFNF